MKYYFSCNIYGASGTTVGEYADAIAQIKKLLQNKQMVYTLDVSRDPAKPSETIAKIRRDCVNPDNPDAGLRRWVIVMAETRCKHCDRGWSEHADGKCLFGSTQWERIPIQKWNDSARDTPGYANGWTYEREI